MTGLSPSAERVQAALAAHGVIGRVAELPASTRSAQEAAAAIGCKVEQIVKSLVFRTRITGRPILVLAGGGNRVDEARLGALAGEAVGKADAAYVKERTGFAIGGVPPVGHREPLMAFIDEDLMQHEEVWAAAGTPHAVFRLTPEELRRITEGQVAGLRTED